MRIILALFALLFSVGANAQTFPGFMPAYTIVCNNTAIDAFEAFCPSFTLRGTETFLAPAAASGLFTGISDTTSVIASQSAFWTGFGGGGGTPGNPVVHTFNRILVGEIALHTLGCHTGTQSWLMTTLGGDCPSSQIEVTSTLGTFAVTAAVRTSDFRTWHASASQGSSAIAVFGINDDTGAGSPIMDTINNEAVVMPGVNGATLNAQFNMDNVCCSHITDPFTFFQNANLLLTPGGTPPVGFAVEFNIDAALIVGNSSGFGPTFNTGIVMQNGSVTTGAGPLVNTAASTVGMAMPDNYAVVWYTAANTASGAIFSGTANKLSLWAPSDINLIAGNGGSANLNINPGGGGGGIVINGNAGVSCGPGLPTAAFHTINGIVVAC